MDSLWKLNRDFAISVYSEFKEIYLNNYDICLAGSIAKSTSVDNKELDIFIKFKTLKELQERTTELFEYVIKTFNYEIKYQTTPYIVIYYKDLKIDLVPCLISDTEKTLVDNTILHVEYVNKHLISPFEVIKLKKLLKVYDIYGSSTELSGYSGYICELLIIKYNTLLNLIKNYTELNTDLKSLLDPTDSKRDLMKGVSTKNKLKLIAICRNLYLQFKVNLQRYTSQFKNGLKLIVLTKIDITEVQKIQKKLLQLNKLMDQFHHYFNYTYCFNKIYIEYYSNLNIHYKVNGPDLNFSSLQNISSYFTNNTAIRVSNTHYFKIKNKTLDILSEIKQIIQVYPNIEIIQVNNTVYNETIITLQLYIAANIFI